METGRKSHCQSKFSSSKIKFQTKFIWEIRALSWIKNNEYVKDEKSPREDDWTGGFMCPEDKSRLNQDNNSERWRLCKGPLRTEEGSDSGLPSTCHVSTTLVTERRAWVRHRSWAGGPYIRHSWVTLAHCSETLAFLEFFMTFFSYAHSPGPHTQAKCAKTQSSSHFPSTASPRPPGIPALLPVTTLQGD